jgi:2-amino-4-hydroxy-6-hydroxymethyldihydropteridine diphosphokinase
MDVPAWQKLPIFYLSLGSNVGQRERHLRDAITRLKSAGRVASISSFYETEPVEVPAELRNQPWFLNCVVGLETTLSPAELIETTLQIERDLGRVRNQSKGPRTIDIDILLFGDAVIESPKLTIPHPAMHLRRFVLQPLVEIAPEICHPVLGKTARELLEELPPGQEVKRVAETTTAE